MRKGLSRVRSRGCGRGGARLAARGAHEPEETPWPRNELAFPSSSSARAVLTGRGFVCSSRAQVMYYIALLMKVIQLGISGLLFNYTMGYSWLVGAEGPVKQAVSVVLVLLILFGQDLNRRVYTLLGVDGVYYGSRFGKKLEWVTAYPYNTISDPQYVGSLCTVIGAAPFLPPSVAAWWMIQYVYLMWLESSIPVSEDDGRHASKSGKSKEAKKTS